MFLFKSGVLVKQMFSRKTSLEILCSRKGLYKLVLSKLDTDNTIILKVQFVFYSTAMLAFASSGKMICSKLRWLIIVILTDTCVNIFISFYFFLILETKIDVMMRNGNIIN